ncbi:MAG: hypothetical protein ACLTW9_18355 [Enterocloster sp.]
MKMLLGLAAPTKEQRTVRGSSSRTIGLPALKDRLFSSKRRLSAANLTGRENLDHHHAAHLGLPKADVEDAPELARARLSLATGWQKVFAGNEATPDPAEALLGVRRS